MFDSLWPHGLQHETSLPFTISQSLLKFMSIESVMLSNHLILCCLILLLPSIFAPSGSFPVSPLFASGRQSIGASVSSSIHPMKIQGWYPLGLTSLISLLYKGISKVFSSNTIWKHQFFSTQPFYGPTLRSCSSNTFFLIFSTKMLSYLSSMQYSLKFTYTFFIYPMFFIL